MTFKKKRFTFRSPEAQQGFSLLEIALGLLILGVVGSVVLSTVKSQQQLRKHQITQHHQERVVHALAAYVLSQGRLPCPADPGAQPHEKGVALAHCNPTSAIGTVPYRTLGLPETMANDGHRHPLTYAVHPALTRTKLSQVPAGPNTGQDPGGFCTDILGHHSLTLYEKGQALTTGPDVVAFVLISHGPSGAGAFCKKGRRKTPLPQSASPGKQLNASGELTFCSHPSPLEKGTFDDHVRWETRRNFASYYLKQPCRPGEQG